MELDPDLVKVVVVDANAVIVNAGNLVSMLPAKIRQKALVGEVKLVTMQQVVDEIKDKKAREALTSMSGAVDPVLRERFWANGSLVGGPREVFLFTGVLRTAFRRERVRGVNYNKTLANESRDDGSTRPCDCLTTSSVIGSL